MSRRVPSSGAIVLGLALLMVSTALAQFPRNRNPQQNMQPIKTGGTLVLAGQNQLQLSTNTNQKILVMVGADTEVSVTGTAEQDYLKSGVNVEFVAEIDKTHMVKEKIIKMLVITPTTERPAGLFAPEFATPTPDKKSEKGGEKAKPVAPDPGIGDAPPVKGHKAGGKKEADPFSGDPSAGKPAKTRSSAPQFPGTFTVRGTIRSCKEGKIKVAAGHTTVQGELDTSSITIVVDMSDFRAAQADDRVTVDGFTSQAQPNVVYAKSITIDLANPLSGAKKHSTHATKTPAAHAPKAKKGTADGDDLLGTGK